MEGIEVIEVKSSQELESCFGIRMAVFVEEQNVPREEECDEHEQIATHLLAMNPQGEALGTCRFRQTDYGVKMERFAVLKPARQLGVGQKLLTKALSLVQQRMPSSMIYLHAQVAAKGFYEKNGFYAVGNIFYEADIPHYKMIFKKQKPATILAIESSCDETSAAVIVNGQLLSNVIATQDIHAKYGGVVPELASRAHQQLIVSVVAEALTKANTSKEELSAVAVTHGPGLLGALLVGHSYAKGLSLGLGIPMIGVNHLQAHILAHFIDSPKPSFPFLNLTVSGGNTQIVKVSSFLDMEIIGTTHDDAVGEAFDKTARLLGFEYPGGKWIDHYAKEGNPKAFSFPVKRNMEGYDYSFSGVKTAFMNFCNTKGEAFLQDNLADVCASIQYTLIEILMKPLIDAVEQTGITQVAIAGGVSANRGLRERLQIEAEQRNWAVYVPDFQYCTDNAGMIAIAAHYMYQSDLFLDIEASPEPNMAFVKSK